MKDIKEIIKGKVIIAPLAGYTNMAYRKITKRMGASLVYTEMVSAKGLIYENKQTIDYLRVCEEERPVAIQLFGGDIEDMVKATIIACKESNPDIIDINMGCPIRKVLKQGAGSELLKDVDKIYEMVRRVVEVSTVPVSVKIRAGIDHKSINCVEVAKAVERAGASLIAIHGRTKSDLYSGTVNLDYIKSVKEAVNIPVVGNGDIRSIEDAERMLNYTKCDYIMIGRKALGNPWFIKKLVNHFNGNDEEIIVTPKQKLKALRDHYFELRKIKPEKIAILEMRSFSAFYLKGIDDIKKYRVLFNDVTTEKQFLELLEQIESSIGD